MAIYIHILEIYKQGKFVDLGTVIWTFQPRHTNQHTDIVLIIMRRILCDKMLIVDVEFEALEMVRPIIIHLRSFATTIQFRLSFW